MGSINEWHNLSQHYGRDWASDDHYVVTDFKHRRPISANSFAYQMLLSEALGMKYTKVLAFKNNSSIPFAPSVHLSFQQYSAAFDPSKPRRNIPQSPEMTLDVNDILDDHYLNLLDWGSSNVLSIALGNTVYLRDESNGYVSEFVTVDDENGPVTSIKWAPDGQWIAVGLNNSDVQLWDTSSGELVRTLNGHQSWVGSLDWNNNSILTTGGMDGEIINNDVRERSHMVMAFKGHCEQVCGLKWSASGQRLASGGDDNLIHIWDISKASSNAQRQWLHRFEDHTAAVRALAWCPFKRNLLASGGGEGDHNIKFWNTQTGACLNSFNTGSEVCALLWNKHERELLSAHGSDQNKLTLWKYPLMLKMADLTGHTSRVLFMAQSPNGCSVAICRR